MRTGVLDIGTNTVLLLVADVQPDGMIHTLCNQQTIARLGQDVDRRRRLAHDAVERTLGAIGTYVEVCRQFNVDLIVAAATSAVRDAANRADFLAAVRERFNLEVRVLSGTEEAELTYRGAVSGFLFASPADQPFTVLDIGGGSTEITTGTGLKPATVHSVNTGCVRLSERFLRDAPPSEAHRMAAQAEIRCHLAGLTAQRHHGTLIGVAGTLTTLAALDLQTETYDPDLVTGHRLAKETVDHWYERLAQMTHHEIRSHKQILPGRADILLAGVMILREVMEHLGCREIVASDRGLRYGLALSVV